MKVALLKNRDPDTLQFYEFIGKRSWLLFDIFVLVTVWLKLPPDQWNAKPAYQSFKHILCNINEVNDALERAEKDVSDFAHNSQDADRQADGMKVVNIHREMIYFRHLTKG